MKFSINSPLMQFMGKLADIMILNIIFIIASLPVFTIGAAWTAMYYVALKMVRGKQSFIIKAFAASFKQNFRQATFLWLAVLAAGAILFADYKILESFDHSTVVTIFRVLTISLAVIVAMALQYLFPSLAVFENSISDTVRNSFLLAIANLPQTVLMLFFPSVLVVFSILNEYTMVSSFFLWLMFCFALIAVADSCMLVKIFDKFIPGSGDENKPGNEKDNN